MQETEPFIPTLLGESAFTQVGFTVPYSESSLTNTVTVEPAEVQYNSSDSQGTYDDVEDEVSTSKDDNRSSFTESDVSTLQLTTGDTYYNDNISWL